MLFCRIWPDEYISLRELVSFCLRGKCTFVWQFKILALDLPGFGKLLFFFFFGPAVCLSTTIPLSKKVNRGGGLVLARLTYETHRCCWTGWGWVPYVSMPVILIISEYILFRWQLSLNQAESFAWNLKKKKKISISEISLFLFFLKHPVI